jgi:polyphosphate kinase
VRWAKKLEDAGAHVVYGVLGLKTHAKASLVVRREDAGLTVYSHVGTGNYNQKTARLYDDLGVLSADPDLGQDLLKLFNHLSGVHSESHYKRLLVAPHGIRNSLLEKIDRERRNHLDGKPSQIRWKVNSLVDNQMIEALYAAAKDGVPIELLVRGACSFRLSKVAQLGNVRIRSILGRFLEHSRIYNFHNGGNPEFYIGSADMMERNLDRRVEALIRLEEEEHKAELRTILDLSTSPRFRMWEMAADDSWHYIKNGPEGKPLEDFQEYFIERYKK